MADSGWTRPGVGSNMNVDEIKKVFDESEGKYGLVKDYIVCNGSYKLSKWNKTSFGIRLYRNDKYDGNFTSKNAAVFLTCRSDEDVTEKLKENKIDMAFVNTALSEDLISSGLKTVEFQNICWVLTLSRDFSADMPLKKGTLSNVYGCRKNIPEKNRCAVPGK